MMTNEEIEKLFLTLKEIADNKTTHEMTNKEFIKAEFEYRYDTFIEQSRLAIKDINYD